MTIIQKGEPMDDLISRQAAIDAILADKIDDTSLKVMTALGDGRLALTLNSACDRHIQEIEKLPSVQPKRKNGEWVVTSEFEDCCYVKCDQCKVTQVFYYNKPLTNFCPNCGADMRGEADGD